MQTMKNLTENHKQEFENQIKSLSTKDEIKVLKEIDEEIEKLKRIQEKNSSNKMENLINNAEFLKQMLTEEDFPMVESTKKWIIFGLGYLISEIDLIPDIIPKIGYNDDALVLQWVIYMIDDDINKYNKYLRAKNLSEKGSVIKELLQGNGDSEIIIIPGFLKEPHEDDNYKHWLKKVRDTQDFYSQSGVGIVEHSIEHLKEFNKTMRIIDHELTLKPVYDSEKFATEWEQIKKEFTFIGKAVARDIAKIHENYPNKEIIIISFNVGNYAVDNAIEALPEGTISRYYSFGGATNSTDMPFDNFKKLNKVYNFFSTNDFALKFVFDNFEINNNPVGLSPLANPKSINVENFNVSEEIKNHYEYKYKISDLLKI